MTESIITVTISNALGMHARAAAAFVKKAASFESEVTVDKNGMDVNGKSIMGLIMLGAPKGTSLTIKAIGPDAEKCTESLKQLMVDRFGEES